MHMHICICCTYVTVTLVIDVAADLVALLLRHNANVTHVTAGGLTPIWIAAHNGKTLCARQLLQAGAEINVSESADGTSALWIACHQDRPETVHRRETHAHTGSARAGAVLGRVR